MSESSAAAICAVAMMPIDWELFEQAVAKPDSSPETICRELSKTFGVRETEVALLRANGTLLNFIFPEKLKRAGTIPVSGSAIAARTALTKKPEFFNDFIKVRHLGVFETIRFGDADSGEGHEFQVIQKLMSVPVLNEEGTVWGILQVCRKGSDPKSAGPDFSRDDLQKLMNAARVIGSSPIANEQAAHVAG